MNYPKMVKIRQKLCNEKLDDIPMKVRKEIFKLDIGGKIEKGDTVAITCGSRGISNINIIIKAVVDTLSELGLNSFIVPAMGSHGSATAEGQKEMIAHYGVTEDFIGVPIAASISIPLCIFTVLNTGWILSPNSEVISPSTGKIKLGLSSKLSIPTSATPRFSFASGIIFSKFLKVPRTFEKSIFQFIVVLIPLDIIFVNPISILLTNSIAAMATRDTKDCKRNLSQKLFSPYFLGPNTVPNFLYSFMYFGLGIFSKLLLFIYFLSHSSLYINILYLLNEQIILISVNVKACFILNLTK